MFKYLIKSYLHKNWRHIKFTNAAFELLCKFVENEIEFLKYEAAKICAMRGGIELNAEDIKFVFSKNCIFKQLMEYLEPLTDASSRDENIQWSRNVVEQLGVSEDEFVLLMGVFMILETIQFGRRESREFGLFEYSKVISYDELFFILL